MSASESTKGDPCTNILAQEGTFHRLQDSSEKGVLQAMET